MDSNSVYLAHQDMANPIDLLRFYPEAKSGFIIPKLRELESDIARLELAISKGINRSRQIKDGWFVREVIKCFEVADLVYLKHKMLRLKRYLPIEPSKSRINQEQINRAKEYPIVQIAESHLPGIKKCGSTYRSLCPYHNEKTPSFYLYPQTNTFHCFGCGEHSDVIGLTQKLRGIDFIEAVKYLAPGYEL